MKPHDQIQTLLTCPVFDKSDKTRKHVIMDAVCILNV